MRRKGIPFFFFVYRRMRFLILGRSFGLKKKKKERKKNRKKSLNSRSWYPRTTLKFNIHIFGLTKCTMYCIYYMFLFLFFSMLLLCSFFRLKELFQVKNSVTTSLLFLPKIWVGRTTVNGEKKEDGLKSERIHSTLRKE